MTPNIQTAYIDDNDFPSPFPFTPTYPVGASTFSIIDAPSWVSIDPVTGEIDIDNALAVKGVYKFLVKYSITVGEVTTDYYEEFTIVIDDRSQLNATTFTVCAGADGYTFKLDIQNPLFTIQDCENTGDATITITDDGIVTIPSVAELATGDNTYTIEYSNGFDTFSQTITITKIACPAASLDVFDECGPDPLRIVWRNTLGGDEVYYFNQNKAYSVEQDKGNTFKTSDRELRYQSRGDVYDAVEIITQQIPRSHVAKIRSLRDSIQAWVAPNIDTPSTWIPIILDSGSFNTWDTIEPLNTVTLKFRYAKEKLIQNQ
jgi:hypothetical protein